MRLLEHESKALLKQLGFAVPASRLARTPEEAETAATALGGPVAIKAQVAAGGRMKAGGVRFAASPDEARAAAEAVLGLTISGQRPSSVLVEAQAQAARELYLGVTYDTSAKLPVAVVSPLGGVDIEEATRTRPGQVARVHFPTLLPMGEYRFKEALASLGTTGRDLTALTGLLSRLARALLDYDLTLAEVNPLAQLADGSFLALDAHVEIEDEALFRQAALLKALGIEPQARGGGPTTPLEMKAVEIDNSDHRGVAGRVVEFDGTLGLIIGGGGASLTIFDAVRKHGGRPANYCEIGGNPSVNKVCQLTKLLLSKPGVDRIAIIMNVVNNTRADLVARGVIKGVIEAGHDPAQKIAIFRVPGAWEEESVKVLRHYRVPFADRTTSLDEAARLAVARTS